jgi:hypothetical protein
MALIHGMNRLPPIALAALVASLPVRLPVADRWNEAEWVALLAKGRSLGVEYKDVGGHSWGEITYGEWRWTRNTPGAVKGLLAEVIRNIESGRITKVKPTTTNA